MKQKTLKNVKKGSLHLRHGPHDTERFDPVAPSFIFHRRHNVRPSYSTAQLKPYSYPGERSSHQFWFFYAFLFPLQEPVRARRTDGQTRPVMRPRTAVQRGKVLSGCGVVGTFPDHFTANVLRENWSVFDSRSIFNNKTIYKAP